MGRFPPAIRRSARTNSKYKVTIVATDPAGAYDTQLVTITVTDVDGTPTVTGPASITKPEKSDRKVAAYTVSDPDPSETFTNGWSVEGTYATSFFEHKAGSNAKERELHFLSSPDYETRSSYTVEMKATNSEGRSGQRTVTITLENVDDGGTVTVSPSTPVVGETVTATLIDVDGGVVIDPDDANHGWTWTHVDAPPGARYPSIRTETYTPTGDDVDYRLRVTVDYDDAQGPASPPGPSPRTPSRPFGRAPPGRGHDANGQFAHGELERGRGQRLGDPAL